MLKVLDVDGAVRRVRGGWEATGQPWAYDEERYAPGGRGPRARAAGDARLPRHRPLPDAVPARPARRPGGRPTAGAATTAAGFARLGRRLRGGASRRPTPGWPGRAWWSSPARCGRPRWPTSASTSRARSPTARVGGARGRPAHRPRPRPGAARPVPAGRPRRPGAGAAGARR